LNNRLSKNEAFLLITGDILIATGGVLLGLLFENNEFRYYLMPLCIICFGLGGYFDYRAIRMFSFHLSSLKSEIRVASDMIEQDIEALKDTKTDIEEAKKDLQIAKQEISKTIEKVFGFSGPDFSRSRGSHPIDIAVEELEKKVKDLEHKYKRLVEQMRDKR